MHEFNEAIRECDLFDLGWKRLPFTWSNMRYGPDLIEEHLDRFLCSKSWGSVFYKTAAKTLVTWTSDHKPVLMDIEENGKARSYERRSTRCFHYEDSWSYYNQCKQIVKHECLEFRGWGGEDAIETFRKAAKDSMAHLKYWSKGEFEGRKKKLELLME